MSSQFSYELDERQIKILMQSGEVDYTETAWQRFESNINKEVSSSTISSFSPKINFGISRSIIVPILFVGLIGGLSVLLFSFVDFKKKEEPVTEVSLKITPPVIKSVAVPKKEIAKISTPVKTVKYSVVTTITTPTVQAIVKPVPAIVAEPKKEETSVAKKTEVKVANPVVAKTENKEAPHKKKRKRKMVSESLQSIAAPTSLNATSDEPELQLK